MTAQSTSQVHLSSLKGNADSCLYCYQIETIYHMNVALISVLPYACLKKFGTSH